MKGNIYSDFLVKGYVTIIASLVLISKTLFKELHFLLPILFVFAKVGMGTNGHGIGA